MRATTSNRFMCEEKRNIYARERGQKKSLEGDKTARRGVKIKISAGEGKEKKISEEKKKESLG